MCLQRFPPQPSLVPPLSAALGSRRRGGMAGKWDAYAAGRGGADGTVHVGLHASHPLRQGTSLAPAKLPGGGQWSRRGVRHAAAGDTTAVHRMAGGPSVGRQAYQMQPVNSCMILQVRPIPANMVARRPIPANMVLAALAWRRTAAPARRAASSAGPHGQRISVCSAFVAQLRFPSARSHVAASRERHGRGAQSLQLCRSASRCPLAGPNRLCCYRGPTGNARDAADCPGEAGRLPCDFTQPRPSPPRTRGLSAAAKRRLE